MAWWWLRAVIVAVIVGTLIAGCTVWWVTNQPPPPDPAANLPPGATLVYTSKHYSYPIRSFRLGGCLFTEFYEYGWELADRAFLGYDPAIDCEPLP